MKVALLSVGEELLAGEIDQPNATWLASELTDRGVSVERILTVPDDRDVIAERTRAYSDTFDAVIVVGGIGGTPDDVTMEAVADSFDREMVVSDIAREGVEQWLDDVSESLPDLDVDIDAQASIPAGAEPLANPDGMAPGCRLENVYVLPGVPSEMKTMFGTIAEEFTGELTARNLYTEKPEANIVPELTEIRERFDIRVGCYPDVEARQNHLKLTGTNESVLEEATEWLSGEIDASESPIERD